jgi:hypothetical protein
MPNLFESARLASGIPLRSLIVVPLAAVAAVVLPGCSSDDSTGPPDSQPPVITSVAWTHSAACVAGTLSDVTITTTVTDADTDAADLTFSGSVANCTGSINSANVTVACPQTAPYASTVTVQDPQGNSDEQTFTIGICEDGQAP